VGLLQNIHGNEGLDFLCPFGDHRSFTVENELKAESSNTFAVVRSPFTVNNELKAESSKLKGKKGFSIFNHQSLLSVHRSPLKISSKLKAQGSKQ
jgi:hypothetical protein